MTTSARGRPRTPEERLLRRTRLHLAAVTMALVATLLAAVGLVTYLAATRLMDENVRRTMESVLQAALGTGELHADESSGRIPAGSDTFVLFLDATGNVVGNPSRVALEGLPDAAAVAAAASGDVDRRDGTFTGVPVRLLTRELVPGEAATETPHEGEDDETGSAEQHSAVGFVQVGFVLALYEEQQRELAVAIMAAVLVGIAGAGLVTLLVTRRALKPIRQAFDAERRFVAAASHELRTPVAIIRASAEVMQREGLSSPAGETLVADIVAETDRLGHLVGDLLALASAEAGAVTIDVRHTDIGAWLEDTARRVAPMIRSQGLVLATDIEPAQGAIVLADPERLTQLLLVLIDNAVAHSPAGATITLAAGRDGSRGVAVSVTDEGPGVPLAQREAIFEPFARTPGVRRTQGSGLGLAIARQLAIRHGATLEAVDPPRRETATGPGARFVLRLPLSSAEPVAPGRPLPGPMSSG